MYTNNKISKAVRLAIAFGAASATAFTASVNAAEEDASAKVERIEITGSRIRQADIEGANPVTVFTQEDLLKTGIVDVGDFIQRMPAMSGSPIGTTTNNGGSGAVTVNLRGLGAARTLVLVNGRRTVDGGDFQTIPSSMIKRIEILKDGASAVYGADAVAGVVNVITRDDFEGVELSYQNKQHANFSAGTEESFSIVTGKSFNSGNVVFGVDYVKQDEVYQGDVKDVAFLQNPWYIFDVESFNENGLIPEGAEGENVFSAGSGSTPCGWYYLAGGRIETLAPCQDGGFANWDGAGYEPTADEFRPIVSGGPGNDTYNYAPVNFLQTPYEKINIFAHSRFDINDSHRTYAELRLNRRKSEQELAAVPYDTQFDPGFAPGVGVSADNYYNPFGEDVLRSRRRVLEGSRTFTQNVLQGQAVIGFEGELTDTWTYDTNYNYGYTQISSVDYGQLFGPNLSKAMGPSFKDDAGNVVCGTPDAPIADCVSLNVFGGPGSITQAMLDYVAAPLVDSTVAQLDQFQAVASGDIFELDAGIVGMAVGAEYRREELKNEVDSGKFLGVVTGNKGAGTNGSLTTRSVFSEVNVPLLSNVPGAQILEAKLGLRYDDFSAFDSATTYQFGIRWQPMDGLLVRATTGSVYRAPAIGNLYAPPGDSFPSASDICRASNWGELSADQQGRCVANGVPNGGASSEDSQVRAKVGGNPDLQPEEGDSLTIGAVWSPSFVDGLTLTVDYWAIEIDDVIATVGAANIMSGCVIGGIQALCDNIVRVPDGNIDFIKQLPTNLTSRTARGVDTEIRYNIDTDFGQFKTFVGWTHLLEREDTEFSGVTSGLATVDLLGTHNADRSDTYAEDKVNLAVDYFYNNLSVSYAVEYIAGISYAPTYVDGDVTAPSAIYHDISAAYDFDFGTRVSVGVTNIFDKAPPYIDAGFNGSTDPSTYRMFGTGYYLRLTHKF